MKRALDAEKAVYRRARREFAEKIMRAESAGRPVGEEWPTRETLRRYGRAIVLLQRARTEAGLQADCGRARDLMKQAFAAIRAARR